MGRSTSCFKLITCGGDSDNKNQLDVSESRSSGDKRGWSFRKRSARHRVLSNSVISETASSGNKGSPESAAPNTQQADNSTVTEKISAVQCTEEKTQFPPPSVSNVPNPVTAPVSETRVDCKVNDNLEESVVENLEESAIIVIQAAVRGFLAQRELLKLKKLIKLQAAVRGHLVRRHAVGTLRCVQAIVKMQALVRARRARMSMEKSHRKHEMEMTDLDVKPKAVSTSSIEQLLSNRFAQQLMVSTSKTKSVHIKCDSSKPNSTWNWLERWMSVSSANQTTKPETEKEQQKKENNEIIASQVRNSSDAFQESVDVKETVLPLESEENMITIDADKFNFQTCQMIYSSAKDNLELPVSDNIDKSDMKETFIELNSHSDKPIQSDTISQTELSSPPSKSELESEQSKRSNKRVASEQLETEGKKFVPATRKPSPSFIAAQSKFEELNLTGNSSRSVDTSHQGVLVDSKIDAVLPEAEAYTAKRTKKLSIAEDAPDSMKIQFGGSECGTELSISSTLDSPDESEVGVTEYEHQPKVPMQETSNPQSAEKLDTEVKEAPAIPVTNLPPSVENPVEKVGYTKVEFDDSIAAVDSEMGRRPERTMSDVQREVDPEMRPQSCRSSPEASPRSHMTVPESHGTPSSQVSVNVERSITEKSRSNQKRKSLSTGKRSPSNPNNDSGARNSTEQLPRDQKTGKRRNSFGSAKPEQIDQEPRDSSSSSSLPHFMQATESARAKVSANNSPRSSPDVQERDIHIKKRYSLPGTNGRQGSPRIQRSTSQAQQATKGNSGNPLHERKWQR